jgi:hypothetical protein
MFDYIAQFFGVKTTVILGGFAGGGVRALLINGDLKTSITAIIAGGLSAMYLTSSIYALVLKYTALPVDVTTENGVAFLTGLSGLFICEGVLIWAKKWSTAPSLPGSP